MRERIAAASYPKQLGSTAVVCGPALVRAVDVSASCALRRGVRFERAGLVAGLGREERGRGGRGFGKGRKDQRNPRNERDEW